MRWTAEAGADQGEQTDIRQRPDKVSGDEKPKLPKVRRQALQLQSGPLFCSECIPRFQDLTHSQAAKPQLL